MAEGVGNPKPFSMNVKQRLYDHFVQGWNGRAQASSEASFYKQTSSFKFQSHFHPVK